MISTETMKRILLIIADHLDAAKDDLCALDGALGDGDLGISMTKGFCAVRTMLKSESLERITPGELLVRTGMQLSEAAPSTLVTLVAMSLVSAGTQLRQDAELGGPEVRALFEAVVASLQRRGKSQPGDKTILDALAPASAALATNLNKGASLEESLAAAASAAEHGAEATSAMQARHGRAGRYFEQSVGHKDAGAVVGAIIMKGFAEGA